MEQSKKHFLKSVVGFSMTSWIAFVIGFIATPIATRLFIPDELGKINMFSNYAALFGALCYLGLDQAFVRFFLEPPGKASRASLLTFCLATSLAFSLVSSLLLLFGWRFISAQVMVTPDFGVFVCLFVFGFFSVIFRYLSLDLPHGAKREALYAAGRAPGIAHENRLSRSRLLDVHRQARHPSSDVADELVYTWFFWSSNARVSISVFQARSISRS